MSDWRTFYTVARPFKFGSRSFHKGEVIPVSDPIAEIINSASPALLLVSVTRTRPSSPRPEVAGLRSSHERPSRDWLAPHPRWRLPE